MTILITASEFEEYKAKGNGDILALYWCGYCYWEPTGGMTKHHFKQALNHWMKALSNVPIEEEGPEDCTGKVRCRLGFCYLYGKGVEQDTTLAKKFFKQAIPRLRHEASELNHGEAWYLLGELYYEALGGLKEDNKEAVKCYRAAAALGHADAQAKLAECYTDGEGVPQADITKAVEWYTKAAKQGHAKAQKILDSIIKQLVQDAPTGDKQSCKALAFLYCFEHGLAETWDQQE